MRCWRNGFLSSASAWGCSCSPAPAKRAAPPLAWAGSTRDVRRIQPGVDERVPHVGWNEVDHQESSPLLAGIPTRTDFYFVHSYHVECSEPDEVIATTPFAGTVTAVVGRGTVFGVQFHPEKSQQFGLRLLANFLAVTA